MMKKHAPATLRNQDAIADILAGELPATGTVLEIASGTGEHAVFFAARFPQILWQPSDPDAEALASIAAYRADYSGDNLGEPVMLDASDPAHWPVDQADAIFCCNMIHISPWQATVGLFAGSSRIRAPGAPIILYGPYLEGNVPTAPSNLEFDRSLTARNPAWGLRRLEDVDQLASEYGLTRASRHAMPANNLIVVYR